MPNLAVVGIVSLALVAGGFATVFVEYRILNRMWVY